MITLTRPSYYDAPRFADYCGLSTDNKATIDANNADRFYEINTAKYYRYNGASGEWVEQPDDTTAVDTGLPPITTETTGHFLSNDGSVTHWQPVASKNFVIQLTKQNDDGTYVADKTFVQIKTAYDEYQNIVVRHDSAQMPLMNVQFADNGNAVFLFGHVEIQTGGQRIVTRAIQYSHDAISDTWTDSDRETDMSLYLLLSGGNMEGALTLAGEPTNENHAANKKYVDSRNLEVRFTQDATAGITTVTEIGEITQAVIANRTVTAILDGDTYMLIAASAADASFGRAEGNVINVLRYDSNNGGVWTKEQTSLLELKGGTMTGNINMGSNAITNVQKIYVDGQANLYLGSVVEKAGTSGVRLTGTTANEAAFVKPTSQNEYVPVLVGNPTAPYHAVNLRHLTEPILADAPASDCCISNKKYVDDQVATRVPVQTANQGQIKAYVANGTKQDVCLVSSSGDGNAIVRYGAQGRIVSKLEPTENTQVANKLYVDNQVKTALPLAGGSITGNLDIGGNLTVSGTATVSAVPTSDEGVANKQYVDTTIDTKVSTATTGMVNKKAVTIASAKTTNIPMTNGVYLVTVCDDKHKGLTCVSVYSSGEDLNDLVTISGWTCNKMPTNTRGITVTNDESTSMTLYITSIGEGNYT